MGGKEVVPSEGPHEPPGDSKVVEEAEPEAIPIVVKKLPWLINRYALFRHPWFRVYCTLHIIVCDFFIFAEDPIQDSEVEANLPFVGEVATMVGSKYHFGVNQFAPLKVALVVVALLCGLYVGRQCLHHYLLRDKLGLRMFHDDNGTFLCMPVCCFIFVYAASKAYNAIIPDDDAYQISGAMGFPNRSFGKFAQSCTWLGDLATVVMVWDAMFQDYTVYPQWATCWKGVWNKRFGAYFRVVIVWCFILGTTSVVWMGILSAGNGSMLDWNKQNLLHTDEMMRIGFVLGIILADILIVMQDWDFPSFDEGDLDIKIAGTFSANITCDCMQRCLDRLKQEGCIRKLIDSKFFEVLISGKWMNYGPLMVILGFDLNMLKNQLIYTPEAYGQYTDPEQRIWTISDPDVLRAAYHNGLLVNASLISWAGRAQNLTGIMRGHPDDAASASRYLGYTFSTKAAVVAPGFFMIVVFIIFVEVGNKQLQKRRTAVEPVQIMVGSRVEAAADGDKMIKMSPDASAVPI